MNPRDNTITIKKLKIVGVEKGFDCEKSLQKVLIETF
jgi:hypothetical protein